MFAGRYLWWTLMAINTFVVFAIYFDFVGWAIVQTSGCDEGVGSCDPLNHFLAGTLQPAGFTLVGAILLLCTLGRILYLRLPLLWCAAVIVWCFGSTDFPAIFAMFWRGQILTASLFAQLPLPMLFLGAFVAYLLLPSEERSRPPFGIWRPIRRGIAATATYGALLAFAENGRLPAFLVNEIHLPATSLFVHAVQSPMTNMLQLGTGGNAPAYIVLLAFVLLLAISLMPEERHLRLMEHYYRFRLWQHPWMRLRQFQDRL